MYFAKALLTLIASASLAAAAASPDVGLFRRMLEDEIYERDVAALGLSTRSEHPDPNAVAAEVESVVRRNMVDLMKRLPHVDCSTILNSCSYNSECQMKSAECAGCKDSKCQEDRPSRMPSPPPNGKDGRHNSW